MAKVGIQGQGIGFHYLNVDIRAPELITHLNSKASSAIRHLYSRIWWLSIIAIIVIFLVRWKLVFGIRNIGFAYRLYALLLFIAIVAGGFYAFSKSLQIKNGSLIKSTNQMERIVYNKKNDKKKKQRAIGSIKEIKNENEKLGLEIESLEHEIKGLEFEIEKNKYFVNQRHTFSQ